jgi:hypothetical protein
MIEALYRGVRTRDGLEVFRNHDGEWSPLPWRLDLENHSPTGLECGYGGSGPAQLALAMLADLLGNDNRAIKLHQDFKWALISKLPRDDDWELTRDEINKHLRAIWRKE